MNLPKNEHILELGTLTIDEDAFRSLVKVFVVTAHRWGSQETHNYIVGIYSTLAKAQQNSKATIDERAGKYDCVIWEGLVDSWGKAKPIMTYRGFGYNDVVKGKSLDALDSKQINKELEELKALDEEGKSNVDDV